MRNFIYVCKTCQWKGKEEELETDVVETCFGNDEIQTCPNCGHPTVIQVL